MNVIEALNARYSCRAYKLDPVSKETVLKILEAAIRAPSWADTQPWEMYVATGETLERLRQGYMANREKEAPGNPDIPMPQSWPANLQKRTEELMAKRLGLLGVERADQAARDAMVLSNFRFFDAPVVIYLCMDRTLTQWSMFDLGLLAQSIMLVAKGHGLDTIPAVMLASYPELVRVELEIPDNLSIVIGVALGTADPEAMVNKSRSPRCPLDEVVHLKGF